ncbi:glycosyltransferase family 4 protein [Demequina pelophila]|uniref:glycosyltransferase family 4 protein n=1 Tax=Demequina pelophila TaxID=1638984 RepID=UPI000784F315|nr:glycosyltransferase family 1 protein [Demequina pelophila]
MRLVIDARFTRIGYHDGISRFGASLLEALAARTEVTALIHDDRQREMLTPDADYVRVTAPTHPAEPFIARRLNALGADVVFSPMQVMGSWGRRYRLILTLHDLIYYRHPLPPRDQPAVVRAAWRAYHSAYWPQRLMLDRADAVATISATTRALMEEHRLTRRPVAVLPNAPSSYPAAATYTGPGERDRTLLYMGSFMPYKNVETLVRAAGLLPDHELHLLSRITPERRAALEREAPAGARLIFHDGVSDAEYHRLLDRCTALVTASRDEGFGIPVVEAMGRGVPVVASDIPIFREIGGDAVGFFPVNDAQGLASRVRELADPENCRARSAAGRAVAGRYSWDASADTLLELARRLHAGEPAPVG